MFLPDVPLDAARLVAARQVLPDATSATRCDKCYHTRQVLPGGTCIEKQSPAAKGDGRLTQTHFFSSFANRPARPATVSRADNIPARPRRRWSPRSVRCG